MIGIRFTIAVLVVKMGSVGDEKAESKMTSRMIYVCLRKVASRSACFVPIHRLGNISTENS